MASYAHIQNLYKDTDILLFRECYALEKIHGDSTSVSWDMMAGDRGGEYKLDPGGVTLERFSLLFVSVVLRARFMALGLPKVTVYGEAYGGSLHGMSGTYSKYLGFIAYDVLVGDDVDGVWLNVPNAEDVATKLGMAFVAYEKIPATMEAIDAQRDADSVQAVRSGMGSGKKREGIVLRPLIELRKNNGERIIAKHKGDEFQETKTPREVSPEQLQVLADADTIADEWCTEMRMAHVLQKLPEATGLAQTGMVIKAMVEDVLREATGEIVDTKEARKAIGKKAAEMYRKKFGA